MREFFKTLEMVTPKEEPAAAPQVTTKVEPDKPEKSKNETSIIIEETATESEEIEDGNSSTDF